VEIGGLTLLPLILANIVLGQQQPVQAPATAAPKSTQQDQGPPTSGAALISRMFAYYSSTSTLTGSIKMVQKAQDRQVTLDTDMAYEGPSKLYVKQVLHADKDSRTWMVTSDGKEFTYDYPNEVRLHSSKPEPGRLEEPVLAYGETQTFQQIFRAAMRSLGDVSLPELVAIGGKINFDAVKQMIATIEMGGTASVGGETVYIVKGMWRTTDKGQPQAKYEMDITAEGKLKRYVQDEIISIAEKGQPKMTPQEVLTTWDLDLHVNAKPDEALFKIVTTGL
jgi:hypothetical protein